MRSWETHLTSLASVAVCGLGEKLLAALTSLSQCYLSQKMFQGRETVLLKTGKACVRVHVCVHRYLQVMFSVDKAFFKSFLNFTVNMLDDREIILKHPTSHPKRLCMF